MRLELQHDAVRVPHRLRPPIAFTTTASWPAAWSRTGSGKSGDRCLDRLQRRLRGGLAGSDRLLGAMEIEPADVTDVPGDLHVRRIAGEPRAGQAVLHDVERLDHHDTLAGPVAHRTRSLRALPRISAGHRQTAMVIHDAPKILL
jgi:hypothetical protein